MSKHTTRDDRRRSSSDDEHAGHRHERLSRILREEIAAVVRDELADPRLDGVRITFVELSVDYKNARIGFIGPVAEIPRVERERLERLLDKATPFLRARLTDAVDLKQVPALRFAWDTYAAAAPSDND
ncbi:Ribosome-binding factor A [Minicystis rosea]|nr:Ribosome-binding factor A [Minicystis rosea]